MLSVPYSSMSLTRFSRRPVRMDAIAITVDTPMTMPRTVNALLNLCALMLSSAIVTISAGVTVATFILVISILRQRDDGIEPGCSECRIKPCDDSNAAGHDEG